MAVMGRPTIEIDRKIFENLCRIHCTLYEIAGVLGCSEDTVQNWCKKEYGETFSAILKRFSGEGKASLKRLMWKHAEKSAPMCMFLAKNLLGYRDSREPEEPNADDCNKIANALRALVDQKGGAGDGNNTANE